MWTSSPIAYATRKLARLRIRDVREFATRSWEIAPPRCATRPRAYFLPNQLERVTGTAFSTFADQRRNLEGGDIVEHAPTRGHLIESVFLIDGSLYKGEARTFLGMRQHYFPKFHVPLRIDSGSIYCTPGGSRYFGQWLMDDCLLYPLSKEEGTPISVRVPCGEHVRGYEEWLEMQPRRVDNAYLDRVVLFDDFGQNSSKASRARDAAEKILRRVSFHSHPGVFIIRGTTGERRVLVNELEIAERLRERRGFRVLDPTKVDVPEIARTVAGARVVMGVEGSGLMHGILTLQPNGAVVTLQHPNRLVSVYKDLADRNGQSFALVVGVPHGTDFWIDPEEVERTLDLLPTAI